jgi:8-oxo-dGTP pyrophosphatase MutT (NUDIX family)
VNPWERNGVKPNDDFASLVFARVTNGRNVVGYVFVIQSNRDDAFYKLPGGRRQNGESPLETAVREFREETGIQVKPEKLEFRTAMHLHKPKPHWSLLFACSIDKDDAAWMRDDHPGNEGEKPKFFTVDEFWQLIRDKDFSKFHYSRLCEDNLILPLGRDKVAL